MRPALLHHLLFALLAGLASVTPATTTNHGPAPTSTYSTATLGRSPSTLSIGSTLQPSVSTTYSSMEAPSIGPSSALTDVPCSPDRLQTILRICVHLFEILAGLCLLSHQGYQAVLTVLSEIRGEQYRFERLVKRLRELAGSLSNQEDDGVVKAIWECQTAGIGLFNAIANTPETIETRRSLRTELERRGLDEHLKVRVRTSPRQLEQWKGEAKWSEYEAYYYSC